MRIFISYSSKYRELCDRLQLALEADGRHEVFVDRSQLTPGQPFDETLRQGIEDCDLLVFLLSPESVAPGSYALAELSIARQHWRHPGGRVLPVKVAPTAKESIPPYLRAVTILDPQGDVVAETVAAVDRVRAGGWRRWSATMRATAVAGVVATLLGAGGLWQWQAQRTEAARVAEAARRTQEDRAAQLAAQLATQIATARQLCESGNHMLAWQRYGELAARDPDATPLQQAREDCAMRWLREIHVVSGQQTFTGIVEQVLPVLVEGSTSAAGVRAGDLMAHRGWADHLRAREGAIRMDPPAYYRKALVADPSNVFAHAMWGHHIMARSGPIDEARQHFAAALAGGREKPFVRGLQFAAMLYHQEVPGMVEAARAAGDMRQNGEPITDDIRNRLWTSVYYSALLSRDRREPFLAGLRSSGAATDAAPTFAWLFPEQQVQDDRRAQWRFFMASLEELAGQRPAALTRYESLRDDLKRERASGRLLDETQAALKRLQGP